MTLAWLQLLAIDGAILLAALLATAAGCYGSLWVASRDVRGWSP